MRNKNFIILIVFAVLFLTAISSQAGSPVWTFTPLTATTISVPTNGTATVQYQVTNQSSRSHALAMNAIKGVTQITSGTGICDNPFVLSGHGSCTLSLQINGAQVQAGIINGPVVCEQGSALQCYKPSATDTLNINVSSATNTTTLSVTPSTLALSVKGLTTTTGNNSGTARVFTIHNTGSEPAMNVACPTSTSPSISSIACAGCGTIASGDSCTATITPSSTASAAVGDSSPSPITLTIQGTNTNTLSPTVNVLTYGSFYQAGWLFSIIETTDTSASIGGTVAAETDAAAQSTTEYSPGGANTNSSMYSGTDGSVTTGNTGAMETAYGTAQDYSAGYCIPPNYSSGGYTDWYLPAICQMGFGGLDINFNCGGSPGSIPNMQFNLLVTNPTQSFNFVNNGTYWSSTASEIDAPSNAWVQQFTVGGGDGVQVSNLVNLTFGVRCVRAIT